MEPNWKVVRLNLAWREGKDRNKRNLSKEELQKALSSDNMIERLSAERLYITYFKSNPKDLASYTVVDLNYVIGIIKMINLNNHTVVCKLDMNKIDKNIDLNGLSVVMNKIGNVDIDGNTTNIRIISFSLLPNYQNCYWDLYTEEEKAINHIEPYPWKSNIVNQLVKEFETISNEITSNAELEEIVEKEIWDFLKEKGLSIYAK